MHVHKVRPCRALAPLAGGLPVRRRRGISRRREGARPGCGRPTRRRESARPRPAPASETEFSGCALMAPAGARFGVVVGISPDVWGVVGSGWCRHVDANAVGHCYWCVGRRCRDDDSAQLTGSRIPVGRGGRLDRLRARRGCRDARRRRRRHRMGAGVVRPRRRVRRGCGIGVLPAPTSPIAHRHRNGELGPMRCPTVRSRSLSTLGAVSPSRGRRLLCGVAATAAVIVAGCGTGPDGPAPKRAGAASTATAHDEGAVRGLVDRYVAAWNAGDGAAFGATYAPEAVHVTFDGAQLNGRDAIAQVHAQLFDSFLRDSRIALNITGFRRLADGVAVVHTSGGVLERGHAQVSADRQSVNTMVVAKHGDAWLLEAVQVTRVAPAGPPH